MPLPPIVLKGRTCDAPEWVLEVTVGDFTSTGAHPGLLKPQRGPTWTALARSKGKALSDGRTLLHIDRSVDRERILTGTVEVAVPASARAGSYEVSITVALSAGKGTSLAREAEPASEAVTRTGFPRRGSGRPDAPADGDEGSLGAVGRFELLDDALCRVL